MVRRTVIAKNVEKNPRSGVARQRITRKLPRSKISRPIPRTPLRQPAEPPTRAVRRDLTVAEKRQTAMDLRVAGYSTRAIATTLEVSMERVQQYIKESLTDLTKYTRASAEEYRTLELERLDRLLLAYWARRAESTKIADLVLKVLERRHKLQGLEQTKTSLTVEQGPAVVTFQNINLEVLDDEELMWLERIMAKALPPLAAPMDSEFPVLPSPAYLEDLSHA